MDTHTEKSTEHKTVEHQPAQPEKTVEKTEKVTENPDPTPQREPAPGTGARDTTTY